MICQFSIFLMLYFFSALQQWDDLSQNWSEQPNRQRNRVQSEQKFSVLKFNILHWPVYIFTFKAHVSCLEDDLRLPGLLVTSPDVAIAAVVLCS